MTPPLLGLRSGSRGHPVDLSLRGISLTLITTLVWAGLQKLSGVHHALSSLQRAEGTTYWETRLVSWSSWVLIALFVSAWVILLGARDWWTRVVIAGSAFVLLLLLLPAG